MTIIELNQLAAAGIGAVVAVAALVIVNMSKQVDED